MGKKNTRMSVKRIDDYRVLLEKRYIITQLGP